MKKIIACLLAVAMLVPSIVSAAPSFGGSSSTPIVSPTDTQQGTESAEEDDFISDSDLGEPDFMDKFDVKRPEWDYGYDAKVKDGELVVTTNTFAQVYSQFDLWENFTMEFDFYIKELSEWESGWFGPNIRGTNVMLINGNNLIQYNSPESGVQNGPTHSETFVVGEKYSMKVEASEKKAVLYLKKKSAPRYTKIGSIPVMQKVGQIGFKSYPLSVVYDNVRIWDTSSTGIKFQEHLINVSVGETVKPELTGIEGGNITYEVADPSIVEVSEDGNITGKATGITTITAVSDMGEKAHALVNSQIVVTWIGLSTMDRELYVGESLNLLATYNPSNASSTDFVWKSSDENVISIIGTTNVSRGIMAMGTGTADVTVTSPGGEISATCTFTVKERPPLEEGVASFALKGTSHEIPTDKFGVVATATSSSLKYDTRDIYERKLDVLKHVVEEVGFNHMKNCMGEWDPSTGETWNVNINRMFPEDGSRNYYIDDFIRELKITNKGIVLDANASTYIRATGDEPLKKMDDMVDILKKLKEEFPEQTFRITCEPEAYAMHFEGDIPTIEAYVEMFKYLSNRIKREVDPDAKIGVTVLGPALYRGIMADPNNWGRWEGDLEYTQGARVATWHTTLAADQSWFDAIDMHVYHGGDNENNVTADEYIHEASRRVHYEATGGMNEIARLFPEKEIWSTEWNDFSFAWGHSGDEEWRDRFDYQSTVGSSVTVMQELCEHMTRENMTISSFYHVLDSSGFGMVEGDTSPENYEWNNMVKTPYFYTLKKAGSIFGANSTNTHAYPLTMSEGVTIEDAKPMNSDSEVVNMQEIYAYGFGDENNVKDIIFTNPTYKTMKVKLDNAKLKKNWEYKPKEADKPYDKFLCDLGVHGFDVMKPEHITLPTEFTEAAFEEYIEVPPYSIVTANVESNNIRLKVPDKVKNTLVLKTGSNKAILPDGFLRYIDTANPEIVPTVINDRTMVPVRIVAESFTAYPLWMGEEKKIGIEAKNYRIDMQIDNTQISREIENFRDGDEEYFTIDVPPQIIGGRTMVPLRAVSEAMDMSVLWDNATGLIIISENEIILTPEELSELSAALN